MSDYSQITFFTPKDSLSTGNPNKIIYGSDVDAELSAISTAIATKADVDGDAIGAGTPATEINVDNLKLDANKIISTNTDGDIELEPNGTGTVVITKVDVAAGEIDGTAIGANSASTGAFTTLTASGDVNFDGGTFFVDASANAVGFGTTSPSAIIQAQGAQNNLAVGVFGANNTNNQLTLGSFDATNTDGIPSLLESSEFGGIIQGSTNGNLVLGIRDNDATDGVVIISGGGNFMTDSTYDTVVATFKANGNVGIGTATPQSVTNYRVLEVGAGSIGSMIVLDGSTAGQYHRIFNNDQLLVIDADPGNVTASTAITFKTDNAERMRIDSSGNLLVGTTDTSLFSNTSGEGFSVVNNELGIAKSDNCAYFNRMGSDGTILKFFNRGTTVGNIYTSSSSTSYNTSSDARLKENIVSAPSASDDIDALTVRSFNWKSDGSHQKYGMVAQELLEVAPEVVHQPDDPEEMMGVDYSKLVPMLVKEIQSLRARVAQLEGV